MKLPKWLAKMKIFSSLRELRAETLDAKKDQVQSQITRSLARSELQQARRIARKVEYINARNHFSESIPDALLGRFGKE